MAKALPKVDVWFDKGAHAGWEFETVDEAVAANKPPDPQIETFTTGFYRGRIMRSIFTFQSGLKYMNDDQLIKLGAHSNQ